MAKPKHRATVYCVVRTDLDDDDFNPKSSNIIGVYLSHERADEVKEGCEQEMKDRHLSKWFKFEVQATSYYDE